MTKTKYDENDGDKTNYDENKKNLHGLVCFLFSLFRVLHVSMLSCICVYVYVFVSLVALLKSSVKVIVAVVLYYTMRGMCNSCYMNLVVRV